MNKYHQRLVNMRKLSRGTDYHTHLAWILRLEEQCSIKERLK